MRAMVGPSICGACYEVPAQMRDEIAAVAPASWCVTRQGTPGLDLRAGLHAQLAAARMVRRCRTWPGRSTIPGARPSRLSSTPTAVMARPAGSPA